MIIINLILIQLIIIFIIDISGVINQIKKLIHNFVYDKKIPYKDFTLKPFDCSLCTTFWTGLIYLLVTANFTLPLIAFVCALSYLTNPTLELLYVIKDMLLKLIRVLSNI